jgi:hypothetical protein
MKKSFVKVRRVFAVTLALASFSLTLAFSQTKSESGKKYKIEFAKVVDTTREFSSFGVFPSINNHGDVAFTAVRYGSPGVFRVRQEQETITIIAPASNDLLTFADQVAINAGGVVAFQAATSANSNAIFKGDGMTKTLIADSTVNGLFKLGVGAPSINATGIVAFSSVLAQRGFPGAIFKGDGGPLTAVASTSPGGFTSFGNAAINDFGTVVFAANSSDGSRSVFTMSSALADIVDTNGHPEIDSFGDPVINNAGMVADVAFVLPLLAPEIFTGTTRGITPRNDPSNPPFANSDHPSLNNHGAVAFFAIPPFNGVSGPTGIFLEVSGGQSLIAVIKPGDKLFGSTVDRVELGRFALNDRFQMVFSYTLTDGRSGIAVASFDGESEGDH